jgi:hypothetical protein
VRVDTALLCDAVTVRENLLHILGGGISRINRLQFPGPLGAALAMRIMLHRTEVGRPHKIEVILAGEDGEMIAKVEADFQVPPEGLAGLKPNEEVTVNVPLSLQGLLVPREGAYAFDVLIDGTHAASVPFHAVAGPLPQLPPGAVPPRP